jgi:hypothetical protein
MTGFQLPLLIPGTAMTMTHTFFEIVQISASQEAGFFD